MRALERSWWTGLFLVGAGCGGHTGGGTAGDGGLVSDAPRKLDVGSVDARGSKADTGSLGGLDAQGDAAGRGQSDGGASADVQADAKGDAGRASDAADAAALDAAGGACAYASNDAIDHDGDGWSNAEGDCNDCNRFINPGAYDIPGDGIDQDCNGTADDEPTGCDGTLAGVATTVGTEGAKALDLCRTAVGGAPRPQRTWGVLSANYVLPDATSTPTAVVGGSCTYAASNFLLGFGLLGPTFGPNNTVQQGTRALGLSSGSARLPTDTGYEDVSGFDKCFTSGAPTGFPGQTPACGTVTFGAPHDGAALQLVIRVPTNALTLSFDANLFTYEFPDYICSPYNDSFVVIMSPSPAGEPTTANENVTFDPTGNPLGVNSSFMTVCDTNTMAGAASSVMKTYACPAGPSKLLGTGFGVDTTSTSPSGDMKDHGATGWITTTVSVASLAGLDVNLFFAVWDSSDGVFDTTVLVDNVRWTFATAASTSLDGGAPPLSVVKSTH